MELGIKKELRILGILASCNDFNDFTYEVGTYLLKIKENRNRNFNIEIIWNEFKVVDIVIDFTFPENKSIYTFNYNKMEFTKDEACDILLDLLLNYIQKDLK